MYKCCSADQLNYSLCMNLSFYSFPCANHILFYILSFFALIINNNLSFHAQWISRRYIHVFGFCAGVTWGPWSYRQIRPCQRGCLIVDASNGMSVSYWSVACKRSAITVLSNLVLASNHRSNDRITWSRRKGVYRNEDTLETCRNASRNVPSSASLRRFSRYDAIPRVFLPAAIYEDSFIAIGASTYGEKVSFHISSAPVLPYASRFLTGDLFYFIFT